MPRLTLAPKESFDKLPNYVSLDHATCDRAAIETSRLMSPSTSAS